MNLIEEKEWLNYNNTKLWKSFFKGKVNNGRKKQLDENYKLLKDINKSLYEDKKRNAQ